MIAELLRPWTAAETYEVAVIELKKRITGFVIDKDNENVLRQLSYYFSGDERFETGGMSLKKGLILSGSVGTGKTEIMRAFSKNKRQCFYLESANNMERLIKNKGAEYWQTYTGFAPVSSMNANYFFQQNIGWCFDDVGTEEVVVDYGNRLDFIAKLIEERYFRKDKIPFSSLHLTTNLDPTGLIARYGAENAQMDRFRSRIREMFNVIYLVGNDRRK